MTLWILICRMTKEVDTLFTFYAHDHEDAEQKAEDILKQYPYKRIELKAYPYGFVMHRNHITGTLEEDVL
jgi:hypothetical protein